MSTETRTGGVTVLGRMAETRGLTAYFVLALAAPPLVALTARQAYVRLHMPDVGLDVDSDLGVESIDRQRWPGIEQRDQVLAVDGVRLGEPKDFVTRALAREPGSDIAVTFRHDGREVTETAKARAVAGVDQLAVWARVVTAALLMAMGLVAFVMRPGVAVTWLLLLLAWDLGFFLLEKIGLYFDPRLYKQSTVYPWAIATSVGLHFLCFFPKRIDWVTQKRWRVAVLYIPVLLAPIVHAFSMVTFVSTVATLWGAVATAMVCVVVGVQYRQIRRTNDEEGRARHRALFVGFAGGLLIPGVWNWLRVSLDIWNSPWAAHYNALPLTLFVGVTAYAVVKHNALAIDRFTASVVGYGVTTIVLAAAFAGLLFLVPLLVDGAGKSPAVLVGVTALTFAGFSPAHRWIKRWVDRRFFRERADAATIADALRDLVLALQRSSRDEGVSAAFEATEILQADRVELWLLGDTAKELVLSRREGTPGGESTTITLDGPLGLALRSGITGGVEELSPHVLDPPAQGELWKHDLAMAAPVMVHGVVTGFLGVGRKRSGAGYELEELSFLTIVAAQLGSTLDRWRAESSKIDRYHIERRIGTGGMAEVFLAWQVGPGGFERKVALKRPLPHVSEEPNAVAAFLDEARLAAQLKHPNIAQVYDVGENAGRYFIVMEFVDGPSLRQVLRTLRERKERVPLRIACAIAESVLAALEYAHRRTDERGRALSLVHRDVTPRNVLLSRHGELKLVDFGIARAEFQLHVTRTGTIKGTLPYMSFEQAAGQELDRRADLYSAGVLAYELVTGKMAFPDGPSPERPTSAAALVNDVPSALDRVLARSLEYDAADRFNSASEQAQALRDALAPDLPASAVEIAAWLAETFPDIAPPPAVDRDAATQVDEPATDDDELTSALPRSEPEDS
jgi:Protein kinase domain/GAF domain